MATNYRGRGGATGRHTGTTTRTTTGNWNRNTTRTTASTRKTVTRAVPTQYKNCNQSFQNKITSYKMLYNQTQGAAKFSRPTPTTLNTFANWINKGANVQTVSCAQVAKWGRATKFDFNSRNPSATACKNILWNKFGKNTIKAVARTKTGGFMVACAPTYKGKNFNFPR